MQLKQFYNIATKVSSRKKCYYFCWSTWLMKLPIQSLDSKMSSQFTKTCIYFTDSYQNGILVDLCNKKGDQAHDGDMVCLQGHSW